MNEPTGTVFLVPNTLDFGVPGALIDIAELLPLGVLRTVARLQHWVGENARTTRAFLKRVDAVVPLARPLQEVAIVELPRPQKGRAAVPADAARIARALLAPALAGHDMGLISEAGLPALADPGAMLVAAAHSAGIRVVALPGASALSLAVAASGLDGQSFAFVGYLPVEGQARAARIRELERQSRRDLQTIVTIETPYRNQALLDALTAHLQPGTLLAVSIGLTLASEFTRSGEVAQWRASPGVLAGDIPAVLSFLAR